MSATRDYLVQIISKFKAEDIEKECYSAGLSTSEQIIAKTEEYEKSMDILTMHKKNRERKWNKLKSNG